MSLRRYAVLLLTASLSTGCTLRLPFGLASPWAPMDDTPPYRGTIQWGCSPIDALAMVLELEPVTGDEHPRISILIWPRSSFGSAHRIPLGGDEREGMAGVFDGGTKWVPAVEGELVLEEFIEAMRAEGWFWLKLDHGPRVVGTFEADWLETRPVLCG